MKEITRVSYYDGMNLEGFYKIDSSGFSLTDAVFYNPTTKEIFSHIIWDIDDPRVEMENAELRAIPYCKEAYIDYCHTKGIALIGDKVEIYKGRKMKGQIKTIKEETTFTPAGSYGWHSTPYWVFTDGTKVAQDNCRLALEVKPVRVTLALTYTAETSINPLYVSENTPWVNSLGIKMESGNYYKILFKENRDAVKVTLQDSNKVALVETTLTNCEIDGDVSGIQLEAFRKETPVKYYIGIRNNYDVYGKVLNVINCKEA